jgi:HSP20 family protein
VWQPALDISQDDGSLVIDVDLPGLDAENIVLEIADGVLRIGGKTAAMRSHDATYLAERKSGAFERVVSLPPGADASKVEAHYGNGVLTVTVALPEPGPATARPIVNWGANSHDVFEKARSPQRLNTIAVTH